MREFLRSVKARTWDALWKAIAAALPAVTQTDAANWFKACGYRYE